MANDMDMEGILQLLQDDFEDGNCLEDGNGANSMPHVSSPVQPEAAGIEAPEVVDPSVALDEIKKMAERIQYLESLLVKQKAFNTAIPSTSNTPQQHPPPISHTAEQFINNCMPSSVKSPCQSHTITAQPKTIASSTRTSNVLTTSTPPTKTLSLPKSVTNTAKTAPTVRPATQVKSSGSRLSEFDLSSVLADMDKTNSSDYKPWERKKGVTSAVSATTRNTATSQEESTDLETTAQNTKLQAVVDKVRQHHTTPVSTPSLEKQLFGADDDSDSDWSDLEGEKVSNLSDPGQELNKIIKKNTKPANATPSVSLDRSTTESSSKYSATPKGKDAAGLTPRPREQTADEEVWCDPYSLIRVKNPLISSSVMMTRMVGRKMIKLSNLHRKVNSQDLEGADWVTIAVIVSKSEAKTSAKGNQYSIWKLSDLQDCDQQVSLFLFGEAFRNLWKTTVGNVIGVLNPGIMKNGEKQKGNSNEVCLSLDMAAKLLLLGVSKDFGICKSRTKAGQACRNVVNVSMGEFCSYHVQAAYKKMSNTRGELQSGGPNKMPKSLEKQLFKNPGTSYIYGGQHYTSSGNSKGKSKVNLAELAGEQLKKKKLTTLALHNLPEEDKEKLLKAAASTEANKKTTNKEFHALLALPSAGSRNFVHHLLKNENIKTETPTDKVSCKKFITAADFIKDTQKFFEEKKAQAKELRAQKNTMNPGTTQVPSMSALCSSGVAGPSGLELEIDFCGQGSFEPLCPKLTQGDLAKQRAIAKVKKIGGLQKTDPNGTRTNRTQTDDQQKIEKIKRRVEEAMKDETADITSTLAYGEPATKKPRHSLLGDLDLNDPEVQRLMQATSAHHSELSELEQEQQDEYFDTLEKKEMLEEKMASIKEQKCKAVKCRRCKYTALKPLDSCKTEQHELKWFDTMKRFYKCRSCQNRTVCIGQRPKDSCSNCGEYNYERCSMLRERKGPNLPTEELLLRGEERKFVNS